MNLNRHYNHLFKLPGGFSPDPAPAPKTKRERLWAILTTCSAALLALVIVVGTIVAALAMAVGVGAAIAFIVTLLWNYAVAPAFGLGTAKFLHVWGIIFLVHIVLRLIRSAVTA